MRTGQAASTAIIDQVVKVVVVMDVIVVVVMVVKVVVVIVVVMIAELRRDWPPTAAAWFVGGAGAVRSGVVRCARGVCVS